MASSRKPSMASTYVNDKRISQWEELMRKFSEAHKEQFKVVALDMPRAKRSTKFFPTGSRYEGSWDVLGMSGHGVYTFPSGVVYEGNFEDGMFHGKGQLRYKNGIIVRGKFVKGLMTERALIGENMEYNENEWKYCKMPDRRFEMEYETGLSPEGLPNQTADLPTREIPYGYYDTGDGFYDPKTKVVYKYEDMTSIVRSPTTIEQQWIVKNCRVNPMEPLGPCPDFYENFTEPVEKLESPPSPAAGIEGVMTTLRSQSIYEDYEIPTAPPPTDDSTQELQLSKMKLKISSDSVKLDDIASPSEHDEWPKISYTQSIDSELTYDSYAAMHPSDLNTEVTFSSQVYET